MELENQKREFYSLVAPSYPNEWEVDEALDILAQTDPLWRRALLSHVPAIWPISNSLCFSYLSEGIRGLASFSPDLLGEWVRQILSCYEEGGLRLARDFMADVEENFLDPLRGRSGVAFTEIVGRMLPYVRGISGMQLDLAVDGCGTAWTDTRTIYLPDRVNQFPGKEDNLLLYKYFITMQWGFIASETYRQNPSPAVVSSAEVKYGTGAKGAGLDAYFNIFPCPDLALLIFQVLEYARVFAMLEDELPGLVRQARPLCLQLLLNHAGLTSAKNRKIHDILRAIVAGDAWANLLDGLASADARDKGFTFTYLPAVYDQIYALPGESAAGTVSILAGQLNLRAARAVIERQMLDDEELFITLLAAFIDQGNEQSRAEEENGAGFSAETDAIVVVPPAQSQAKAEETPRLIRVNNEEMELPLDLGRLITQIEADLGTVPSSYMQAAVGMAGRGQGKGDTVMPKEAFIPAETVCLDEWDYRRSGYRKNWCCLYEKELTLVTSNFVPVTLAKHQGLINRVKRQFEMLRTTHRFVRRRRYGDDLDFDAIVEALGDQRAGFAPSDRLFIRLLHDERDIATLFLVDMSNSTEGWIGNLIKESLVILGEVMEVVGDRYGIYGFSGMRRSRCELFHIKHLDEMYGGEVKSRIAAIGPREYTRMGPPLRYLTRILQGTDARLRLLITLTDGKPEDYDGYVDEYAIEDTRKALVEARGAGILPFCLNIDQKAGGYLRHMYGEGNYICVNTVANLPLKMAEFYRVLTS